MPDLSDEFADNDEDFAEGDGAIDWSNVEELAERMDAVSAIADDDERLEAAKHLVAELDPEDT